MHTKPVPLKCEKLSTKYPWICGYFYSVRLGLGYESRHRLFSEEIIKNVVNDHR